MERLKKRSDFLRTARGYKRAMPGLVLQTRAHRAEDGEARPARIGYTASRRVGGAVQRNRARRRLREAVRKVLVGRARPGHDYVLIARPGTLTRKWDDLLRDLEKAAEDIHRAKPRRNSKHTNIHTFERGLD
ncbi:MAG: ribonuclease P protein component [Hyphomicrobiales bacterium]|nr:MAG: ribonuclease P protein component [Hyphomicrobiales bacterium]